MKFISTIATFATAVSATVDHSEHDHSALKPTGIYYGLLKHTTKAGDKTWNDMEVQMNFGESSLDLLWWFGVKHSMTANVAKQVFKCDAVPFAFDEEKLMVTVDVAANACLNEVKNKFTKGIVPEVVRMPVNHDSGDLTFGLAMGIVSVDLYAIDGPLPAIPSGVNGLAPVAVPARRGVAAQSAKEAETTSTTATVSVLSTTKSAHAVMSGLLSVMAILALAL